METKISSISQLDEVTALSSGDLFVVSEPNLYSEDGIYTKTGYTSKKLTFGKFSNYLSALVLQDLVTKISNISGNVYSTTSVVNQITGTLIQNINTQIEKVSGNVNIAISSLNNVSGDVYQNLSTNIQNISGNVSSVQSLQTNVDAISADIQNNINTSIANIAHDVYSDNGISANLSAVTAHVNNEVDTQIEYIAGDVYATNGIDNKVSALCSEVTNNINVVISRITGDVVVEGGIFNWISGQNVNITNMMTDISALSAALHYPIVELNDEISENNQTDYVLKDKTVNVAYMNEAVPYYITFAKINSYDATTYYSRDFEFVLYCNVDPEVHWDNSVQYMSPDGDDILNNFSEGQTYVYYISEIGKNIMYISRQEIQQIAPNNVTQ